MSLFLDLKQLENGNLIVNETFVFVVISLQLFDKFPCDIKSILCGYQRLILNCLGDENELNHDY